MIFFRDWKWLLKKYLVSLNTIFQSELKLYPGWLGQEIEKIKVYMLIQIGTIVIVPVTANVLNVFAIIYGHRPTKIVISHHNCFYRNFHNHSDIFLFSDIKIVQFLNWESSDTSKLYLFIYERNKEFKILNCKKFLK